MGSATALYQKHLKLSAWDLARISAWTAITLSVPKLVTHTRLSATSSVTSVVMWTQMKLFQKPFSQTWLEASMAVIDILNSIIKVLILH